MIDEEELRKRMQQKPMTARELARTEVVSKPEAKSNPFADLLPFLGGTGGAAGGAALGASLGSVVPGIGTVIGGLAGGILGGGLGSGAGQAGKNIAIGEEDIMKDVGKEALLGGVTSLPPIRAARGVGALVKGGGKEGFERAFTGQTADQILAGGGRTAAQAGRQVPPGQITDFPDQDVSALAAGKTPGEVALSPEGRPMTEAAELAGRMQDSGRRGFIDRAARRMTEAGSGLKIGKNVGDLDRMGDAVDVFRKYDIAGTPRQQLSKIDDTIANLGEQVDDILSKNPVPLSGTDVRAQIERAVNSPLTYADLDLTTPGASKYLASHLEKFAQSGTAKEMNDYVKTLNPVARRAQMKLDEGKNLTEREVAAVAAKRAGDDVLSAVPEIRPLKRDMAQLFNRNPEVAKLANEKSKLPVPFLDVKSGALKQGIAGAQSKAGQILAGRGGSPAGGAALPPQQMAVGTPGQQILRGAIERPLLSPMLGGEEQPQDATAQEPGLATAALSGGMTGPTQEQQMQAALPEVMKMEALNAMQAGDMDTAKQLLAFSEAFAPADQELTALQKQSLGKVNTAEAILDRFEGMLGERGQSDFGPAARLEGLAANVGAFTGLDQDAKVYNDLRQGLMSQLAKSLGESGQMAEGDIKRALALVPALGETKNESARKLSELRALLRNMRTGISGAGGGAATVPGTDAEVILQSGY